MKLRLRFSDRFVKQYKKLHPQVQRQTDKAIAMFMGNSYHPGLHFEKLKGFEDIHSLRVNRNHRILLRKCEDCYECFAVDTHDVYG